MSYVDALLLAVLQGITEFLPVSSSGHLILAQHMLGRSADIDLVYDILLHVATAGAVLTYFRSDVVELWHGLTKPSAASGGTFAGRERQALGFIVLAQVPTLILGLGIERHLTSIVTRPGVVGGMLMLTGCLLWSARARLAVRSIADMRSVDALAIGVLQGVAIVPGISRAGATITGGLLLGLERELVTRFSLLISIPAILGAAVLQAVKLWAGRDGVIYAEPWPSMGPYVAGMVLAAVIGYLSIGLILRAVRQNYFHLFAWYLWPVGLVAMLGSFVW